MAQNEKFSLEELSGRWARLQAEMVKNGLDGLMVSEASNFIYLTGHESGQFLHRMRPLVFLLPATGKPTLFVYAAEVAKMKSIAEGANFESYVDVPFPVDALARAMAGMGWQGKTIGAELGANQLLGMPVNDYMAVQAALSGSKWVDAGPTLMTVQMVKTPAEIEVLEKACQIAERAWTLLLERIHPGVTAAEIRLQLALATIEAGADGTQPFAAHVTHLSLSRTDGVFREGDMLKCDFHTRYRNYWSDLCRLAVVGEPSPQHIAWHKQKYDLLKACMDVIKPGVKVKEVATLSNQKLEAMGKKPLSPIKRIGHGIGLEATTPPSLNMLDETVFQVGMTVAVEPRIPVEIGGLLIEESVVVTETGYRQLTHGGEILGVIR